MLLTHAVQPDASEVISEAWFYVATHFLTEIWDRKCCHQKAVIFSQKMGINILGGPLRKSNLILFRIFFYGQQSKMAARIKWKLPVTRHSIIICTANLCIISDSMNSSAILGFHL